MNWETVGSKAVGLPKNQVILFLLLILLSLPLLLHLS